MRLRRSYHRALYGRAAVSLISLLIVSVLMLQTFAIVYPVSPRLWPFLDYPMYGRARYEGEAINRYLLLGILPGSREVRILPEDLNLDFWKFEQGPVRLLRRGDTQALKPYVDFYNTKQNATLLGVRLENHPIVVSKEGVREIPPQIVREARFDPSKGEY